jgi:hypothetical protein
MQGPFVLSLVWPLQAKPSFLQQVIARSESDVAISCRTKRTLRDCFGAVPRNDGLLRGAQRLEV